MKFSYGYLWHKSPAATFIFNAYHGMFIFMYQRPLLTNIRWKDLEWHCVRDLWKFEWKSEKIGRNWDLRLKTYLFIYEFHFVDAYLSM